MGRMISFSLFLSLFSLFSLFISTNSLVHSSEIDSFTNRDPHLQDSTTELNRLFNQFLENGANWANRKVGFSGQCLHSRLFEGVNRQIKGLFYARVETLLERSPRFDKIRTPFKNSIYNRVKFRHGFALYLSHLGAVLRVGDHYVGTDKFGHFFDTGYDYYQEAFRKGRGEEGALKFGERTEWGIFGYRMTGVYSYGDLVANYQGFRFWKLLTDRHGGEADQIYFKCQEGYWKQVRTFDIRDFLDAGWDEGINCSRFKVKGVTKRVNCPLNKEKCADIVAKYGEHLSGLVSPTCRPTEAP